MLGDLAVGLAEHCGLAPVAGKRRTALAWVSPCRVASTSTTNTQRPSLATARGRASAPATTCGSPAPTGIFSTARFVVTHSAPSASAIPCAGASRCASTRDAPPVLAMATTVLSLARAR